MEQVIFLHADEDSEETLSQLQHSLAQRLVLVAPAQMDRLRLSLLLRLARRQIIAQAGQLCVVSEDRLARLLAARMGFSVAATLDEYRGLTPGLRSSSRRYARRPPTRSAPSVFPSPGAVTPSLRPSEREASASGSQGPRPNVIREKPGANLAQMLEDGYLPNPAAIPGLEEEEERAAREERERLHYEIADEEAPSQAQQEAEQHEVRIIARILKTSRAARGANAALSSPATPDSPTDRGGDRPPAEANKPPDRPPDRPEDSAPGAARPPENRTNETDAPQGWDASLRPMLTIDELLLEWGQGNIFDWFERQAARATAAIASRANPLSAAQPAAGAFARASSGAAAAPPQTGAITLGGALRQRGNIRQVFTAVRPPGAVPGGAPAFFWRRLGVIGILTLSLLMLGMGLALIPSAEVHYREEITPYSQMLLLHAGPGAANQQAGKPPIAPVSAEVARFDGVLTAQAPATGQALLPDDPTHPLAYPTRQDIDQLANYLQAQLQRWGEAALRAQQGPGDILGPATVKTEVLVSPPAGERLPAGVTHFQVSLALHLRATLIRHQALLQAAQRLVLQEVQQRKAGFAPREQWPKLRVLSAAPAGPGAAQLDLLVRVQVSTMIGPTLTPAQARAAIAGQEVTDAEAYLSHQPGISAVSIQIQPKWLNRLPIFSSRIRINLESAGATDATYRA